MIQEEILSDGTLTLRAVELSDVDILYRWENDTTQWITNNAFAPYSRKQLWDYANNYDGDIFKSRNIRFMIATDNNICIGTADLYDFDPVNNRAFAGIYISKSERGLGYAVRAMKILVNYAKTCIGMKQIAAITDALNDGSIKMLEKCGFSCCGTLKSWIRQGSQYRDALLFQHVANDM